MNFQVIQGVLLIDILSLLILTFFITIGTAISYYEKYGKDRRISLEKAKGQQLTLKKQIDLGFIKVLGFNLISIGLLYILIILIFRELAKIEQLITLIKLWFVAEFALLMTRIKRDSSDQNLQQINQILGNFNLSTFSPVATGIQQLLVIINLARDLILKNMEREKNARRDEYLDIMIENLQIKKDDFDILKEYIQDLIDLQDDKCSQKKRHQQQLDKILAKSEKLEIKNKKLCWLMIDILPINEINQIAEDPEKSRTYSKLNNMREESLQSNN